MKNLLLFPCLFLISACGDDDSATVDSQTASEPAATTISAPAEIASVPAEIASVPVETEPVAQTANLPWDIPTIPNARVIHGSSKFSRTTARRGGESTALIALKGSAAEIVAFYEQALPDLDFKITHSRNLDEKSSTLSAEHADGRQFKVFANRGGSKAKDGESSATLVATKPKLTE